MVSPSMQLKSTLYNTKTTKKVKDELRPCREEGDTAKKERERGKTKKVTYTACLIRGANGGGALPLPQPVIIRQTTIWGIILTPGKIATFLFPKGVVSRVTREKITWARYY